MERQKLLEKPGPGAAVLHVKVVNRSPKPVDVRWLHDLRPALQDDQGLAIEIADVRALERPHPDMVAAPPPSPELLDPGESREVVRWSLSPGAGGYFLDVPYAGGSCVLVGKRVTLSLHSAFAVHDSLADYRNRLEYSYRHFGKSEADARRAAAAAAAELATVYARLADSWTGEARSPRYELTLP
jgi:hypothetical protein